MPVRGYSSQWKNFEGLIEGFALGQLPEKATKIRQLLELLDEDSGPMIYVGTSHGQM